MEGLDRKGGTDKFCIFELRESLAKGLKGYIIISHLKEVLKQENIYLK